MCGRIACGRSCPGVSTATPPLPELEAPASEIEAVLAAALVHLVAGGHRLGRRLVIVEPTSLVVQDHKGAFLPVG